MKTYSAGAIAALLLATAAPVAAATYITGTETFTGLGDTLGTPYDRFTLNSVTGTATGPGTYLVNTVDFVVGVNSNTAHVDSDTFTDTALVDGSPFSYTVPYTISISSADTIVIGGNSFTTDGYNVTFSTLTLTSDGSAPASGDLFATVSAVPEPASWAMMLVGAGLAGAGLRRRRQVATPA